MAMSAVRPVPAAGNGPLARADQQRYDNDAAQVKRLASTADVEQKQLSLNIATARAKNKAEAEMQLPAAQKALQAARKEQAQELGTFTSRNASNGGLLIRLQALGAVTSHDATLNAARWLLFLLFVVIDCMPVMIKVMLNLGPENNYDRLLKVEEQRQLSVGASNTALRQATEMMAAVTVLGERQSRLAGWTAPIPELAQETIDMRRRVEAKRLEVLEKAQIRLLGEDAARLRQTSDAGLLMGSIAASASGPPAPPRRWWRRRSGRSQPHSAPPPPDTLQPVTPGNLDKSSGTEHSGRRQHRKAILTGLDWFSKYGVPFIVLGATIWFTIWFTNLQSVLADQQHKNDIALTKHQHQDDIEQTYLSDIRDLLSQHLSTSRPDSKVRQIAIEDTVTTMRVLDARRNVTVFRFLRDAGLLGPQDEVIDLSGADLSGADLNGVNLAGVAMYGANLTRAHLRDATLTGASLSDAILTRADLTGARLGGAILTSANLKSARLSDAILAGADLTGAKGIDQAQFNKVDSCRDAIPPTQITCRRTPIISLTYWYTESDREKGVIIHTLIHRFQQKYRGIHIRAASLNFFDTRAAFTAAGQRGHAPDVLRSDLSWTQLFASEGYLLNIDSYAYQSDLNLSDYRRLNPPSGPDLRPDGTRFSPLTYAEYNGHLYGLPQVTDVLALLYNKKELAEAGITGPPRNMAQFEADAVRVVQQKKAAYGFETDGTFNKALPFLYACGGGLLDQHKNNILVNDKGSVSGLNLLLHMRNEKVKPIEVNLANGKRISPIVADFKRGATAMIFDGPYDVSEILTGSSFSHDHGNLGIAGIPRGPAGQTGSPLGGQSYVISSSTPYPAEAYKFIKFMSSENSQISVARANHTLPTLGSATRRLVSTNSFIRQFHRIWATEAVARPTIPKAAYLFDVADPSIRAVFTRNQSANQALNTIANSWNQLGAGNEIPQSALTPGTSQTACS